MLYIKTVLWYGNLLSHWFIIFDLQVPFDNFIS